MKNLWSQYRNTLLSLAVQAANTFDKQIEIMRHENALAVVGNYDVVFALRPVAKELSQLTGNTYVNYLDKAKEMLLEGNDIREVLYHFDIMLHELKKPYDKCSGEIYKQINIWGERL